MRGGRILLIGADYSPANTPGATRIARFVRHLPSHGWQPSVLAMQATPTRVDDNGAAVVRARGFDVKNVFSVRGRYLALTAFPDRSVSWVPDGVRRGLQLMRERRIDVIYSTSPPVSSHLIGWILRRRTGRPWIAELRDPWNLGAPFGPILQRFDRNLAARVYGTAERVVVTNEVHAEELAPSCRTRLRVVRNAFDDEHFLEPPTGALTAGPFRIVHAGQIGGGYRDPGALLKAVRLTLDEQELPPDSIVEFYGVPADADAPLRALVRQLRLEQRVQLSARVPRQRAIDAIRTAGLVVVLQERSEFARSVPSKLYEALRSGRAILVIAPAGSATERLARGMAGVMVATDYRANALAPMLAQAYQQWRTARGQSYERCLDAYRAERVTAQLADVLEELVRA